MHVQALIITLFIPPCAVVAPGGLQITLDPILVTIFLDQNTQPLLTYFDASSFTLSTAIPGLGMESLQASCHRDATLRGNLHMKFNERATGLEPEFLSLGG